MELIAHLQMVQEGNHKYLHIKHILVKFEEPNLNLDKSSKIASPQESLIAFVK